MQPRAVESSEDRLTTSRSKISIVVPVFNSEQTVAAIAQRTALVFAGLDVDYEIVFVNDGSRDNSWSAIVALAKTDDHVVAVDLMRNYGQNNAVLAGIRQAVGDTVVTMDDDLQHPPEEIPKLLATLSDGVDVAYGTWKEEGKRPGWRRFVTWLARRTLAIVGGNAALRNVTAFRAFRTDLRRSFETFRSPYILVDLLLSWGTARVGFVEVSHHPRESGVSQYGVRGLLRLMVTAFVGFSVWPLRIASLVGVALMTLGIGAVGTLALRFVIAGTRASAIMVLTAVILTLAGAQLVGVGLLGEYLSRTQLLVAGKPTYAVRRVVGAGEDGTGQPADQT